MAFYKQDIVDINLNTGSIFRSFLNHSIGFKNDDADRFGIRCFRDGEPVDLSGASCQAVFMAPNGVNIALTSYGTVSGNVAYVTLPPACYDYEGQFCLSIQLVGGGVTGTMRIVDGMVVNTGASGAVAPTASVPTYQEIIAQYDAMVAATSAANLAIAETFDATKAYPAGKYVINEGHLYRLTADHAANVTWADTSKVTTNFGDDLTALKSALSVDEMALYGNDDKTINGSDIGFIKGNVYVDNGEITFPYSAARIRNTNALFLSKDSTVKLSSYSGYKFFVTGYAFGYAKWGVSSGWKTADYTIPNDGLYYIVICNNPEQTVSDISILQNLLSIQLEEQKGILNDKQKYTYTNGFINSNGNTSNQSETQKEIIVSGVQCSQGEKYRVYVEQNNNGSMWIAYCAYSTPTGLTSASAVGGRQTNFVEDFVTNKKRYGHIDITIPTGAISFAFSYRQYTGANYLLFKIVDDVKQSEQQTIYETANEALEKVSSIETTDYSANIRSINHRGYSSIAPENTIPAFQLSRKNGFKIVETDVRGTADNIPICMHDETINRTCCNASDGSAISSTIYISSVNFSGLNVYDACTPAQWPTYKGTKIPSLEQFLKTCKYIGLDAYIEIKQYGESFIQSCVDIAIKTGMLDHVSWICFDTAHLAVVKAYAPTARLGLLANDIDSTVISNAIGLRTDKNEVFIDASISAITSSKVALCVAERIPLEAWTVYYNDLPLDPYVTGMTSDVDVMGNKLYNINIE